MTTTHAPTRAQHLAATLAVEAGELADNLAATPAASPRGALGRVLRHSRQLQAALDPSPPAERGGEFATRLATALRTAGMSGYDLERATDGTLLYRSIHRWRSGKTVAPVTAVPVMCAALGVSAAWLLGMSDEGGPRPGY